MFLILSSRIIAPEEGFQNVHKFQQNADSD